MKVKGMDRREFLKVAAAGTAAISLHGCIGPSRVQKKPNVVFVFDDQLRSDVCGIYGGNNISTPHIDRLAGARASLFPMPYPAVPCALLTGACCKRGATPLTPGS